MTVLLIILYVTAIVVSISVGGYLVALALISRSYSKSIENDLN